MAAPPSQKNRRISFTLTSQITRGDSKRVDLVLRPEELTRQEPSRLNVQQTIGGAWADAFGRGISGITLSGHTGWRGSTGLSGEELFAELRTGCFKAWHDKRAEAIAAGKDPDTVRLFLVDNLDDISALVAPRSFSLRRSKTSPLLLRYQIQLAVLDDGAGSLPGRADPITGALTDPSRWTSGIAGLDNVINRVSSYGGQLGALKDSGAALLGSSAAGVGGFLDTGTGLLGTFRQAAQGTRGVLNEATSLLHAATSSVMEAGRNGFGVLGAAVGLTAADRALFTGLASSFSDAACTLANSFLTTGSLLNLEGLFGASNCSSTGGGRPASAFTTSGRNPFDAMFPQANALVAVDESARVAMARLRGDPLSLIAQTSSVPRLLGTVGSGVRIGQ